MAEYVSPDAEAAIPAWVALCGRLAPFSSILMFLSPIPTIRQVLRTGTVGDLPLLPYTSMVASCFVWIVYGILKREPMIWGTNIVEFILSVYYFVEFTNYAPKSSATFPGSVYRHIQFNIGTWICSVFIALFFQENVHTIGDLTVLLTILTFASPLAAVKAVLESQSSESIPWPFTLAALFNCCLWTIVGVFEMHDGYVASPAILGLVFASIQVALKLYFGDHMNMEDNPSYTKAPVEMPYPVLGSLRQVVNLGNNNSSNTTPHYFSSLPQDLHFESNMASNTDYVELGMSQAQPESLQQQQHHHQLPQHHGGAGLGDFAHHHKVTRSNEGLEHSVIDGLQTIVFEDESSTSSNPPHPASMRDSFRSRSNGGSHGGGGGLLPGHHAY